MKQMILSLSVVLAAAALARAEDRLPAAGVAAAFDTPEAAVAALESAAKTCDSEAFLRVFGPSAEELQNPDRTQATNEWKAFRAALGEFKRVVRESDTCCTLEVGTVAWPFPVPLVLKEGKWFFDAEAGKDELLSRRIGRNELSTLCSVRAYVEAQREYATQDRDSDEVLEYAQRLLSTPGAKDGLYWPPEADGGMSPLGPLVAQAQSEGYAKAKGKDAAPEPFHGYFFKILTAQAKSAAGGKYSYVINGNMIGGFALVAWPASYGETGIMTFMVNQQGRVCQRDLGQDTGRLAKKIRVYDPDKSWTLSQE